MAHSLYIHWPFCAKKCPYCDFNSHVRAALDSEAWQAALLADMRREAEYAAGGPLASVFFGGGTPSLMPPNLVAVLLNEAERLWGFDPDIEITLEANPSSVEASNFAALATAGINRVSLGIQSFEDKTLQWLGRLHGADEALAALDTAQYHFKRVNFDLIYALPDQTETEWEAELHRAIGLGTSHLSLYQLTIEPGTRFETDVRCGVFEPLDNDRAASLYALTQDITAESGLPAYEISNHAAPGQESQHNLTYWRYQDYCGIGPGAHGRRSGVATQRHRKPENFLRAVSQQEDGISETRSIPINEQATEALLMGLRLTKGIDLRTLASRFGISQSGLIDPQSLARNGALGLIEQDGAKIKVTPAGMPLLDALLADLVADDLVSA